MRKPMMVGIILIVVCTSAGAYIPIDQSGDLEVSLNGEWSFMLNGPEEDFFKPDFDVSGWALIKVPGNWEVQAFEEPLYKEPREGVGLYRRIFEVPAPWKDRRVFIRFEGVLYGFEFWVNGKRMTSGDILVSAPPHGKDMIAIELDLKDDIETTENLLRIVFADFYGRQIYERSVHLVPESGKVDFAKRLSIGTTVTPHRSITKQESISSYQFGNLLVRIDHADGKVKLLYADSGTSLLEGPIVRVGRTPVMAEWRNYPRYNIKFWENPLLQNRIVIESTSSLTLGPGVELKMKLDYPSLDKNRQGESILVDLRFHVSGQGWIDVDYELTPQNATGNFLDFGLAFKLPVAMKHLTWIGDGPYNSYPGQTDAAERGIWHIAPRPVTDPESRYYEGNRANVDLAAVTDGKGNGIGVICDGSTVSLEEREGQQIFSQVLRSSGKGNKTGGMMTLLPVKAAEVKSEKGTMRFVLLMAGKWPALFEKVLGPVAEPHGPY